MEDDTLEMIENRYRTGEPEKFLLHFFRGRWIYIVYCPLLILCCYGFSPVIRFYSTDSAVFYCMGKAMSRGVVVYRDIFDHKGIWLYFFNCIGAYFDRVLPGWGMYIVEILLQLLAVFVLDQLFGFFIHKADARTITVCLFWGFSLNYFTYGAGNLTESYALVFQLVSSLFIVRYYLSGEIEHPSSYMLIHGFCSGICLFLRMNLTAMWIPFGIALAIRLLKNGRWNCFFRNLACLMLGIMAASFFPLVYCLHNHCLEDMLFCSFFFNISYLNEGGSLQNLLRGVFLSGASIVIYLSLASLFLVITVKRLTSDFRWMYVFDFLFTTMITFMGMRSYGHYFHTLLPFALPAFIGIGVLLQNLEQNRTRRKNSFAVLLLICMFLTLAGNLRMTIRYLPIDTEYKHLEAILEKTTQRIEENTEDTALLSTENLMQAYVITGKDPETKYPYIPAVQTEVFPEPVETMYGDILSGEYKYIFGMHYHDGYWNVLAMGRNEEINDYIKRNYTAVFVDDQYSFVLFERNT